MGDTANKVGVFVVFEVINRERVNWKNNAGNSVKKSKSFGGTGCVGV